MKGYQSKPKTVKKKHNALEKKLLKLVTKKNALFLCGLIFLSSVTFGLLLWERDITQAIKRATVKEVLFAVPTPAPYPVTAALQVSIPSISAQAAIILDNDSKVVIFAKSPKNRFPMASTTKIMSALVALEHYRINDVLTIRQSFVGGVTVGFRKGERVFLEDLLYAMLLPSGNDAAVAIAQNYPGGQEAFVAKMNKKAKELHLLDTNYTDPSGLSDGNYTTPFDLAHLATVALKQPILSQIVSTKTKVIRSLDGNTYTLINLNKLLGSNGVYGMKTGFTDEAGGVLVTLKKEEERTFVIVIMKSADRFADTEKLLSLISGKVSYQSIHP